MKVEADIAPVPAVAVPTLMAAAARHPNYLTQGMWPIAPLAQPNLLRLGGSLPVEWRAGKTLFVRRLARVGFGPALTHPEQPESFADTMTLAMRTHAPRLLRRMSDCQSWLISATSIPPDCPPWMTGPIPAPSCRRCSTTPSP